MPDQPAPAVEYGVTALEVMASMPGLDFVRAIFDGELPAPPIMQTVEPFELHRRTRRRRLPQRPRLPALQSDRLGTWRLRRDPADSAMGLAVHSALPAGTGYTTLEFKISFIKGMTTDTGPVRPKAAR